MNVYFDNTGGDILEAAMTNMATGGRIVVCGGVSQYDSAGQVGTFAQMNTMLFVAKQLTMAGGGVTAFREKFPEARKRMRELAEQGKLVPWYTEVKGLANAPQAFVDMVNGGNSGSVIIRP